MDAHVHGSRNPWPAGPRVTPPVLMAQTWSAAVFLHWRIDPSLAAPYMPPGVEPDVFHGSTWVGLIGFRAPETGIAGVPVPFFGSFTEVNVRLYSRGRDGSRGVLFLSLDASRLVPVLAARALHIPYVWSLCRPTRSGWALGYDVERFGRQARSSFAVVPDEARQADDDLSILLTARFGLHAVLAGRTVFIPISHRPWPLHPARLTHLHDELVPAAGLPVEGPPDTVHYSAGVRTLFGRPRRVA
ncbi:MULTISPECIES: DUF2071 domain-containing protein [unclassified Arthrobacter]|uniref:YqjF family protein n=1 Tax=unclassified Arthrobacter TaxID=235627 RepID=UPI001E521A09|nr:MULTISPECIES: DUF2071 domain-containing protein [unclassified Arthrobacter]MCC9145276.1 DUF2071 domain-containing protein [Arthrobacter sp. zg-Y919]MDK1276504.1 DUF2071 domain-containing protein [Arthrobacter sp. zg.Y919]WIB01901.1 DUF2071 domain-containing protein [Arthrobacter sp. zg-Y919]